MRRKHSCPRIDAPRYCSRGRSVVATVRSSAALSAVLIGSSERLARFKFNMAQYSRLFGPGERLSQQLRVLTVVAPDSRHHRPDFLCALLLDLSDQVLGAFQGKEAMTEGAI